MQYFRYIARKKWNKLCIGMVVFLGICLCWSFSQQPGAVLVSTGSYSAESATSEEQMFTMEQLVSVVDMGWSILAVPYQQEGGLIANILEKVWTSVAGFHLTNPYSHLQQGVTLLKSASAAATTEIVVIEENEDYYVPAQVADTWQFDLNQTTEVNLSQDVQVILYHTHNAETYLPSDGVSKIEGENGGVAQAADVFKEALEGKYGIKTLHSKVLHDYPDWTRSYVNSYSTITGLLNANTQVKAVFDVHRDAGFTSKEQTTVTVNGQKAAKIMIVVGANHENWQSNMSFAQQLEEKSNVLYPGLLKDIRIVQQNRYNQQVHPQALILEIGSDLNTKEEADFSMECFSQVVAEVLLEQSAQ